LPEPASCSRTQTEFGLSLIPGHRNVLARPQLTVDGCVDGNGTDGNQQRKNGNQQRRRPADSLALPDHPLPGC
jgi:hypothetical protein